MIMVNKNEQLITFPGRESNITYEQLNTINIFRRLWDELAMWTRSIIHASINETPDLQAVSERYYKIPTEFYNAFYLFYGPEVSQELSNGLLNFIIYCLQVIEGMKKGDQEMVNSGTVAWYQSADKFPHY